MCGRYSITLPPKPFVNSSKPTVSCRIGPPAITLRQLPRCLWCATRRKVVASWC
jgi:hypothetical protein